MTGKNKIIIDHTKLFGLVDKGNIKMIKYLITYDVNAKDRYGDTALIAAAWYGNLRITKELINIGADINIQDKYGDNALMISLWKGNPNIANYCLHNNTDINVKDKYKNTALIYAAEKGYFQIIKDLIEKGADVNAENKYGRNALMIARKCNSIVSSSYSECVKLLEKSTNKIPTGISIRKGRNKSNKKMKSKSS